MAHRVRPAHGCGDLADQFGADVLMVRRGGGVGDHRNPRRRQREPGDEAGERLGRVGHVPGVERAAHGQRVAAGAGCHQVRADTVDALDRSGDHQLVGGVVVGDVEVVACAAGQHVGELFGAETDDHGHAPAGGEGHQFGASPHQPQAGGEVEDTGGFEGVVLPQTVAGQEVRRVVVPLRPVPVGEGVDDVQGGLGVAGVAEFPVGVAQAQPLDGLPEDVVGLGGEVRELCEEFPSHAAVLGALPGEHKRDHC
jgi:hypothetical protein